MSFTEKIQFSSSTKGHLGLQVVKSPLDLLLLPLITSLAVPAPSCSLSPWCPILLQVLVSARDVLAPSLLPALPRMA